MAPPISPDQSASTHPTPPTSSSSSSQSALSSLRTLFAPTPPSAILADLAPHLLQSRILQSQHFSPHSTASSIGATSNSLRGRLGWPGTSRDANSIHILERVDELLAMDVPPAPFDLSPPNYPLSGAGIAGASLDFPSPDAQVPLIRGFQATTPAARVARIDRRRKRAGLGELALGLNGKLGLKERGDQARGLLAGASDGGDLGINRRTSGAGGNRRKGPRHSEARTGLDADPIELSPEELVKEAKAVEEDMSNVAVRRVSLSSF